MNLISIEIGGSKLQIFAGTESGHVLERCRFKVDREAGGEGIRERIAEALPDLLNRWAPEAIGAGYGGPVNCKTGVIKCSHHVRGWDGFPLSDWLAELTGLPAAVENDANAAALGEALFGAGRGANPVAWVNCGSGVGGGLVVDGRIYHGAVPGEMEIGHLRLDPSGTIVEDRCSGWALDRAVRSVVAANPDSILAKEVRAEALTAGEARAIVPALNKGCPEADRLLTSAMNDLAFALSHVVHLAHPEVIVVGGGLHLIGEQLRKRVSDALSGFVMSAFGAPPVALARLGEESVLMGGLALASSANHVSRR
jgi:glucokinase